eukprot:7122578-Lingulodinium_polyedra.AAC.1
MACSRVPPSLRESSEPSWWHAGSCLPGAAATLPLGCLACFSLEARWATACRACASASALA